MASTASFTNQIASQALNGEAVIVTVASDEIMNMQAVSKGMLATNSSSGNTGLVHSVDYFGSSFKVTPIQPNLNFESAGTYGYLAINETVTVQL